MRDEIPFAKQVYRQCHSNVHIVERELDVKLSDSHLSGELTNRVTRDRSNSLGGSLYSIAERCTSNTGTPVV